MARVRPVAWLAASLVLELVLGISDAAAGNSVIPSSAYLIPPLVAALGAPPRYVAIPAVTSVLLILASGGWNDYFFSSDHLIRVAVVIIAGVLAIFAAQGRDAAVEARRDADSARRVVNSTLRRLDAVLGALAEAVTVHDRRGKTIYANQAAVRLLGAADIDELLAAEPGELAARFIVSHEDGRPVAVEDLPGRRAVLGQPAEPLLTRSVVRATGQEYWLLTKATVVRDEEGAPLAVNIIEDVTQAKDAELRQRFLASATGALAASLDYAETLERLAHLAVPQLADWCAVDVLDEHGDLQRLGMAHSDPERMALGRLLHERYPPDLDPDADAGMGAVLRTGKSELYSQVTDEMLAMGARDEEHLRLIRELGMRSAMVVPMRVGARTLGVMTFVSAESRRVFEPDDLSFAEDLAARAAVAVENARLYSDRAAAAHTLQQSLLPQHLPAMRHWTVDASYRPGEAGSDVGGDFYDVFPVEDGHMVVLGDVTGKGIRAAALTSLVRHTARTGARFDARPAAVLALVDEVLRDQPELSVVTMGCALLSETGETASVRLALGGHPLPLCLNGRGQATPIGEPGVLLGAVSHGDWPETEHELTPGETILFFTDGCTDTPGEEGRFGEERLIGVAADGEADPREVIDRIDEAIDSFRRGNVVDDRALLAVQYNGAPLGSGARPRAAELS